MKVEYECGCKFDSDNLAQRGIIEALNSYCFPDICPIHKDRGFNNAVRTLVAPEAGLGFYGTYRF